MSLDEGPAVARPLGDVFGAPGYCCGLTLASDELRALRALTVEAWLAAIRKHAPQRVQAFERAGIENYHLLAQHLDHDRVWTTHTRTFDAATVDAIRAFSIFKLFDRECPGYRIATAMPPYGDLGRPRVNWRLVRPGAARDVGPAHADYWFDAVLDGWTGEPGAHVRVKIWIAIFLEPGMTGFACIPGSHLDPPPFKAVVAGDGSKKPALDCDLGALPLRTLAIPPGTVVAFNYNLVHAGINSADADKTRVSMEFTLEVPRAGMERLYGSLRPFH